MPSSRYAAADELQVELAEEEFEFLAEPSVVAGAAAIRMTTTSQANQAMNATSSDGADAGAVVWSMETRAIRTSAIAQ